MSRVELAPGSYGSGGHNNLRIKAWTPPAGSRIPFILRNLGPEWRPMSSHQQAGSPARPPLARWGASASEEQQAQRNYVLSSGVASNKLRVYGCCGRVVTCSAGPISTIFPRCITAIRVARYRTTGMECEMNR